MTIDMKEARRARNATAAALKEVAYNTVEFLAAVSEGPAQSRALEPSAAL